ncbi:DNA-binding death effector domain-containing protein 2, partial [Eudyptes moseleyi]
APAVESLRALSQLHSPRGGDDDGGGGGGRTPPASSPMSRPPAAWEEEECLEYYGMASLHRLFEVVGAQLTPSDVAVLSFLLDEAHPASHPLDPALWGGGGGGGGGEGDPPHLLENWNRRRRRRRSGNREEERARPRNGVELLLELERRGLCDEGNFRHLLELLRLLTRHDLLHCVTLRRPRTVSPERFTCGPAVVGSCLNAAAAQPRQEQWETGRCRGSRRG